MGKHLTPDERARVAARYVETANASQVAREFGVDESTVRRIAGASKPNKTELHTRAVAQAIRKARRSLARKVDTIDLYLLKYAKGTDDGVPDLEPKDIAALVNASAGVLSRLLDADANLESKKLSRLTRDLRRAEIELARLKIAAGGVEKHEHVVTQQDAAKLAREVFGSPSALERTTDGPSASGDGAVAADVLPVPTRVDR